jgi:hypothetical protein
MRSSTAVMRVSSGAGDLRRSVHDVEPDLHVHCRRRVADVDHQRGMGDTDAGARDHARVDRSCRTACDHGVAGAVPHPGVDHLIARRQLLGRAELLGQSDDPIEPSVWCSFSAV